MLREIEGLAGIAELDGGLPDKMFRKELETVMADLHDRPANNTARKVVLTLSLKPVQSETGRLASIDVEIDTSAKLPRRLAPGVSMRAQGEKLVYNDESRDNVDQMTIDQEEQRRSGADDGR